MVMYSLTCLTYTYTLLGCPMGRLGFIGHASKATRRGHSCDGAHSSVQGLQARGGCCHQPWLSNWCLQQHHLRCEPEFCAHGHWRSPCGGVCLRAHWWRSEGRQDWLQEDSNRTICSLNSHRMTLLMQYLCFCWVVCNLHLKLGLVLFYGSEVALYKQFEILVAFC